MAKEYYLNQEREESKKIMIQEEMIILRKKFELLKLRAERLFGKGFMLSDPDSQPALGADLKCSEVLPIPEMPSENSEFGAAFSRFLQEPF